MSCTSGKLEEEQCFWVQKEEGQEGGRQMGKGREVHRVQGRRGLVGADEVVPRAAERSKKRLRV